jgi:hypothetical protein
MSAFAAAAATSPPCSCGGSRGPPREAAIQESFLAAGWRDGLINRAAPTSPNSRLINFHPHTVPAGASGWAETPYPQDRADHPWPSASLIISDGRLSLTVNVCEGWTAAVQVEAGERPLSANVGRSDERHTFYKAVVRWRDCNDRGG